jgi:alkylhydroperoxidase/carboxymuconolactone decarboxylase family protein YurZ
MEDIHNIFSQFKSEFPEIHQKHEARAAGITEDEIKHALLLLIPTAGFPAFMKSYAVLKSIK